MASVSTLAPGRDAKKREHDAAAAEREQQERDTARQLSRKLQDERKQRVALLATRDGLLQKVAALEAEAQLLGARGRSKRALDAGSSAATQQVELTNLLKGSGELCDGFVLELLRRLVEECGVPFLHGTAVSTEKGRRTEDDSPPCIELHTPMWGERETGYEWQCTFPDRATKMGRKSAKEYQQCTTFRNQTEEPQQ